MFIADTLYADCKCDINLIDDSNSDNDAKVGLKKDVPASYSKNFLTFCLLNAHTKLFIQKFFQNF